jgi:hypothetical protein
MVKLASVKAEDAGEPTEPAEQAAWAEQADWVRELFSNPFRPAVLDPSWLTWRDGTIPKIAESIYRERSNARSPILAVALTDAGSNDAGLLGHLPGPDPHCRGCWALNLILGKS